MKFKAVTIMRAILTALLLVDASVYCQDPKPTPSPETRTTAPATASAGQEKTTNPTTTTSPPAPSPEPDYWHQEFMTGDWGGTRSRWKEKGIELEFRYIGIFQSLASGGIDDESSLTNRFETVWNSI